MPSVDVETSFVGWVALRAVTLDVRAVVPILRIVDVERARDFYVGYLGFTVDWEDQFDDLNPRVDTIPGDEQGGARMTLLDPFGNSLRVDERRD